MLEKPSLQEECIAARVQEEYELQVTQLTFLPLGADVNTAVYRLEAADGTAYFLKLRRGFFDEMTVAIPQFLEAQGIGAIIAPLWTKAGGLWGSLDEYKMIVYPFIEGQDGYQVAMTERQWITLGAALKGIHATELLPALKRLIRQEDYSSRFREMVRKFQALAEEAAFTDPIAAKLAGFMQEKRGEITHLVSRADQLSRSLMGRSLEFVLCHSDIHPGNLLIGPGEDGGLYIVDWDNPILAPKERDLMFIGAGMGNGGPGSCKEALFYQGYGSTDVDRTALTYYRYERIVQDIAAFCEQIYSCAGGEEDREQSYRWFTGQFLPDHEVDVAIQTDPV